MRFLIVSMFVAGVAAAQTSHPKPASSRRLGAAAVAANVNVKAFNPAGSLRFVGWDKDSLVVYGTMGRGERFMLSRVEKSALKVVVDGHWNDADATPSELTIYLPRQAMISAKTVAADIVVENVSGWFWTVAGSVRVTGRATSLEVESMSGNVDLNAQTPWIKGRTGSGNLLVRGEPQDVDLSTVSGTLGIATATILRGQFSSVTGDIHYAALPSAGGVLDFSNHSGAVDLSLPDGTSAQLTVSSISGPLENGLASVRPTAASPHSARITLGRGDAHFTVRTFKGPIRLRRD